MAALVPARYLEHLEHAAADVAAVLASGDLDAPVPGCPPWRLTDLAHHLGGVHRWARTAVLEGRAGPEAVHDAPTRRPDLVAWFLEGAAELVTTLRLTDPGAPCWTFGPHPRTAAFWFRRQAHETVVHAADAAASQGVAARSCGAELALDGVDEVVRVFLPRQVRLGRIPPLSAPVALDAAGGRRWVLGPGGAPVATVSGPAEALLMLLWRRTTSADPRLVVTGRRDVADAVLASALTP